MHYRSHNHGSSPAWWFHCFVTEYFARNDRRIGDVLIPAPDDPDTPAGREQAFYHQRSKRIHDLYRAAIEAELTTFIPQDILRAPAAQAYVDNRLGVIALLSAQAAEINELKHPYLDRDAEPAESWRPDARTRDALIVGASFELQPGASCASVSEFLSAKGADGVNRYHVRRSLDAFADRELDVRQPDRNLAACQSAKLDWQLANYCWSRVRAHFAPSHFTRKRWSELNESGLLFAWRGVFEVDQLDNPTADAIDALVKRRERAAHLRVVS